MKNKIHFLTGNWHNFALFIYILICALDFLIMPIYFEWTNTKVTLVQMIQLVLPLKDGPTQIAALQILHDQRHWQPLTLQQNGLFHVAFGAILGVGIWSKGQENMTALQTAITNNGASGTPGNSSQTTGNTNGSTS